MITDELQIAVFYIGLNGLITLLLALKVVQERMRTGVNTGDGGDMRLAQAIRAHGNNVEYVPLALILLTALALLSGAYPGQISIWLLHGLGIALTVARIAHGLGLLSSLGRSAGRAIGALLTWLMILVGAVACIWYALALEAV